MPNTLLNANDFYKVADAVYETEIPRKRTKLPNAPRRVANAVYET